MGKHKAPHTVRDRFRLEQPAGRTSTSFARWRQKQSVQDQAIVVMLTYSAFIVFDPQEVLQLTLSSRPSMTSSILSWSIVSKAALMSILTKCKCGLSSQRLQTE